MSRSRLVSLSLLALAAFAPACTSHDVAREEARAVPSPDVTSTPSDANTIGRRSQPAPVRGLWAELLSVGSVTRSQLDPAGKPAPTPLFLRVHNTTNAPIALRTGGDGQSIELAVRGPGVARGPSNAPCTEIYIVGRTQTIPAGGSLDVPLRVLVSGARCAQTSFYLEKAGMYELDVTLHAHVMDSLTDTGQGHAVDLAAATLPLRVS